MFVPINVTCWLLFFVVNLNLFTWVFLISIKGVTANPFVFDQHTVKFFVCVCTCLKLSVDFTLTVVVYRLIVSVVCK